jgi:hypothetical protein
MPNIPYNNNNPNEGFFCNINNTYRCPLNNSCKVKWNERLQMFNCECHNCKFSLKGMVISGPSKNNLTC